MSDTVLNYLIQFISGPLYSFNISQLASRPATQFDGPQLSRQSEWISFKYPKGTIKWTSHNAALYQ